MKKKVPFKLLVSGVFLLFSCAPVFSQSVSNVSFEPTTDNKIRISYYLTPSAGQDFRVELSASTDGGQSFFDVRSAYGDVGHVSGTGWKSATWDVLRDVDQFVGPSCQFRVAATEVKSFGNALGTFYGGSESTKSFVDGFAVYGGWQNTIFKNQSYSKAIGDGTLTNAGGWNAGARYMVLPFLLDANYISQTFRVNGSDHPIIYSGVNVSLNFTLLPLFDFLDAYGGAGYQASELSLKTEAMESDAQTNGPFWNAGAQINITGTWRVGVQYSESVTSGYRNWKQLIFFAGINVSTRQGGGK